MEDSLRQNYELAYHIQPNVDEKRILEVKEGLEELITKQGGAITFSKVPERTHLSYPIRRERSSYFGYVQFSLTKPADALPALEEHIKLNADIIRHLTLKLETDAQKQKTLAKMAEHKERQERRVKRQAATTGPKADSKEMEKQLEEVIGNL